MANTQIVNDEKTLLAKLEEVRKAQAIFATYTQEQVDKIFFRSEERRVGKECRL